MALNGDHSSFIPCTFYRLLTERWKDRGLDAFRTAYYGYAIRKGIRCAQHVVHEGLPLNMRSYNQYREAEGATPESLLARSQAPADDKEAPSSTKEYHEGSYISKCYNCGTPAFIRAYGLPPEYEQWNCTHIDRMMVHAYNPDIFYEVTETLVTCDHCEHHCQEADIRPEDASVKRAVQAPPFGFLIWSEYCSMAEIVEGIFGQEGRNLANEVQRLFVEQYGQPAWDAIEAYRSAELGNR